ncbi:nucleotidyl transferase AbiEii/AbiGii toxin family protein [Fibrobacter sp. UWEL]|uniref:nucleotidyl transferase AbiEii/AbiGii toxin family protein n=1 Tax=Fibrobacter sp. UWEL TaxID=1896209 RepID=UPI00091F9393|nr:nucleotidyl transferase AbiEii/AbiGii toxin family protein [Fibrobacter sp. UWEL]SHL08376.1 Nucleotidyl transferase AbiEii toxin, Type IV TA system [Fibrobacter sp. UWEL]
MKNAMSLKASIRNRAKELRIPPQVLLQNLMFERFMLRLSKSPYRDKFVVKGGMLIAATLGLSRRSTMDLDMTLQGLDLNPDVLKSTLQEICSMDLEDGFSLSVNRLEPIREDDFYGGFRVFLDAKYEFIDVPMTIDVSTGDAITPSPERVTIAGAIDDSVKIRLLGYNLETILAEKVETILSRSVFNTRPRDFYDVYALTKSCKYDKTVFEKALEATSKHRESAERIGNSKEILERIESSEDLMLLWKNYSQQFEYAKNLTYSDVVSALKQLV